MIFEIVDTDGNCEAFEERNDEWSDAFQEAILDALWVGDVDGHEIEPGQEITIRRVS